MISGPLGHAHRLQRRKPRDAATMSVLSIYICSQHREDGRRRMPANELRCIPTTRRRQRKTEIYEQLHAYIANISYDRRCPCSSLGFKRQLLQRVINCCENRQNLRHLRSIGYCVIRRIQRQTALFQLRRLVCIAIRLAKSRCRSILIRYKSGLRVAQ